jgi:two-component system LytT family response regulator
MPVKRPAAAFCVVAYTKINFQFMKITALIVDDEINMRETLVSLIKRTCPEIEIIGEAGNVADAYDLVILLKPVVVFLDIEMPGGNGFELLSKFKKIPFETVFVSSYGHYAIRALRLSALDYLLKPVLTEELMKIPERLRQAILLKESAFKYLTLQHNLGTTEEKKRIVFHTKQNVFSIDLDQIIYLKADSNYTYVFSTAQKTFIHTKSLRDFEDTLCNEESSSFMRIHKKFIVNVNYIGSIVKTPESLLILKDGTRLEVSRRKKQQLLDKFNTPHSD